MSSNIEIEKVCEFCGQLFIARTMATRYCSHQCNSRAYKANLKKQKIEVAKTETMKAVQIKSIPDFNNKELFTISDAALFIGVSRPTVYNYLRNGELKSVRLGYKTFIRRSDINALFDNAEPYKARPNKERKPITEFYTLAEITEKYGIKTSWIYKITKENNIPKVLNRGKVYFSKQHIDNYFRKKGFDEQQKIVEWYTVAEVCEKYNLTVAAVYSFVSERGIPRKKDGRTVYYSKKHFDAAKNKEQPEEPEYYTVEEAMEKFRLTRDSLYGLIKSHSIPKVKTGRYIKILKSGLDKLFEKPIIL